MHGSGPAGEARAAPITAPHLEEAVRAVEPAVRLVPPRLLRRVIRRHTQLPGFGLRVPHCKSYVIPREPLLEIADRDELGFGPDELLPPNVILLERPGSEELADATADAMLVRYWRLLFHARVHQAMGQRAADGKLAPAEIHRRIQQIGAVEFDEIRNVLRQERFLLPPYDDATAYVEFAAVYLELRHFAPHLLASYFPGLASTAEVDRLLSQDVDGEELFLAAWVPGAPDPADLARHATAAAAADEPYEPGAAGADPGRHNGDATMAVDYGTRLVAGHLHMPRRRSERKYLGWMARAERAVARGNLAGAAVRRARAVFWAPRPRATIAATALRNDVHRLVARIQAALDTRDQDPRPWRESLLALAHQSPRGPWSVEARLLYDLQKVCADHEHAIYTVDVVEWILSLGKRPIRRPLPSQREVLMAKHLRSAVRRLAVVRLSERLRRQLSDLLYAAIGRNDAQVREHFRPRVTQTLEDADLRPQHLPERVAKKKLVEELLDRIIDRGFLTLGDLRDGLSRNNLKQPDCSGPMDFLRGDALLRADRRLAVALDGVYQRGEFYLRWIQGFSLLAFGTRTGRFLTRYLAVPFGGAYVILAGLDHFAGLLTGREVEIKTPASILILGVFFLGLLHIERFRRGLWEMLKATGRAARYLLVDSVRWMLGLALVRRLLDSRWSRLAFRFVVKPLVPTLIFWKYLFAQSGNQHAAGTIAVLFLSMNLALNSRLGRNFEELAVDWLVEGWHRFGVRLLTGVFWFVVDLFRRLLEMIEKLLYTVDEWLRFKSGETRLALVAKAALGVVWFFVSYVVRFCVNLLIEPQVNPIKHVPVVTVSHKIIFPFSEHVFNAFVTHGMSRTMATMVTFVIIFGTPGIFGFLVWELKENWRLFAANRSKGLGPVLIGQHGETMGRLLKPGFHSGTVPKRFAKLRRAERRAMEGDDSKAARKHRQVLQHVEISIRRYLEREFVELFAESYGWQALPPGVGPIRLATNGVRAAILLPGAAGCRLWIELEATAGWTLGGISGESCAASLSPEARHVLRTALIGLYKTAGVDLVRQQIAAAFPLPTPPYDLTAEGLVLWPDPAMDGEVFYDLKDGHQLAPQVLHGFPRRWLPTLDRTQVVFRDVEVAWEHWVAAWEEDRLGDASRRLAAGTDFWADVPAI